MKNQKTVKKINARPLRDRIIVEVDKPEKISEGGIHIPDTATEKKGVGTVLAVGPGSKDEPMELKVGDRVKFSSFSGVDIDIDGEEYKLMFENEVLCVIE